MSKVTGATDVGKVRGRNEDSFAVLAADIYVLADGMGGQAAGEVASQLLVDTVSEQLPPATDGYDEESLRQAVLAANDRIFRRAQAKPELTGMGTTAVLFHIEGSKGCWAYVGDSRLYLLRGHVLQQLTTDHSLVESLLKNGSITPEEAKSHPRRNILTRAVGVEPAVEVDTGTVDVCDGDVFLLCSDGLTNMVSDEAITAVLQDDACADKARELINKALQAGGMDNITAIVVECDA